MSNIQKTIDKVEQLLLPVAEAYLKAFPEIAKDKTFNARQTMVALALKINETKSKTGQWAIDCCTPESFMQVAQEILVKRLDPLKKQCALIVRGDKLVLQGQYQGNMRRALDLNPILSHFNFVPIYKDDKLKMIVLPDGRVDISNHETSFINIGNDKIVGGYVSAIKKDGSVFMTEIMNMEQIKMSWSMGSTQTQETHKKFPVKMIRKTILNSLCVWLIDQTGEIVNEEDDDEDIESNANPKIMNVSFEGISHNNKPKEIYAAENVMIEEKEEEEDFYLENQNNDELTIQQQQEILNEVYSKEEEVKPIKKLENGTTDEKEVRTVPYAEWKEKYVASGEWEIVPKSYNGTVKPATTQMRRK